MRLPIRPVHLSAGVFLPSRRWRRVFTAVLAAGIGIYLLLGWLAVPGLVQSWAENYVLRRSGHHLTMDKPSFNPFTLTLHVRHLQLAEPDGRPLLSFKDLVVDVSSTSLFRRACVFDDIRLDGVRASVAVLPHNRLNWSALIEAFQGKEKTSSEMPRLIVKRFTLSRGRVDLRDARTRAETATYLFPLNIRLTELSTLPEENGRLSVTAKTDFGARIRWDGQVALKPVLLEGTLRIDSVPLVWLARFAPLPENLSAPQGVASLATRYRVGMSGKRFDLGLDHLSVVVDGFRVQAKHDPDTALAFTRVALLGGRFELQNRRVAAARITLQGGGLSAVRSAKGTISLTNLFAGAGTVSPRQSAPASLHSWQYHIGHIALQDFSVGVRDLAVSPSASFAIQGIAASVDGISNDLSTPLAVHLAARSRDGGTFAADGTVIPATRAADFQVKLDGLVITPVQPYVASLTTLKLKAGSVSAEGHVVYDGRVGQYAGAVAVQDLNIVEADGRQVFLAWKSLGTRTLMASPTGLSAREVLLDGLDTRLIIAKDKTINLTQVLRARPGAAPALASARDHTAQMIPVRIERLRLRRSQLEFADHSLVLPFGTHIHALSGTVVNITSRRDSAPARLQLQGQIDDYGMARAAGKIDLFKPADQLDIRVDFTNVEMARLTPYSATFAGRRIDSGKLTLNLQYRVDKRQLQGNNRIVMDQLTLGERVKSPSAHDLPLDLAIAILEDSHGRIDLGLPVSGSLDDPKFSYRAIVWKAITNVLTKIATAPFRALGALFGGDEHFDGLSFEAGKAVLTPPEREKLVHFAEALGQRPRLSVIVHGTWSEADRAALQDLQLRRALAEKLGLSRAGDPGLLTPDQLPVQVALENLYVSRFGNGALAGIKDAFRKANPGQLPQTSGGRMMAVMTGIIGTRQSFSDLDVAAMKGADFYALLYRRLREAEIVSDPVLQALADARGAAVLAELGKAKVPVGQVSLQSAVKTNAAETLTPLRMDIVPTVAP